MEDSTFCVFFFFVFFFFLVDYWQDACLISIWKSRQRGRRTLWGWARPFRPYATAIQQCWLCQFGWPWPNNVKVTVRIARVHCADCILFSEICDMLKLWTSVAFMAMAMSNRMLSWSWPCTTGCLCATGCFHGHAQQVFSWPCTTGCFHGLGHAQLVAFIACFAWLQPTTMVSRLCRDAVFRSRRQIKSNGGYCLTLGAIFKFSIQ